jgi:ribose-phosphate pyrophosphokinase
MSVNRASRECATYGDIKLFSGTASPVLAKKIAKYLNQPLSGVDVVQFSNENLFVKLHKSVRGQDVFVIQATSTPVHRNLMELLIMLQTLRLDSAGRVTAVVPYMAYARSDKKDMPRVPITARLIADMIEVAGADRYITLDLHAGQIQGFFSIPGDVLTAFHIITDHVNKILPEMDNPVVLAADLGFAKKGRNFAAKIGAPIAFVEKRRRERLVGTEALTLIGNVSGRDVIVVDDEVDTGGSMSQAVELALENNARNVYVVFVHAVLSGQADQRLSNLAVKEFITTDTIPIPDSKLVGFGERITVLSIAPLLGEVILRAHEGRSVGELFHE